MKRNRMFTQIASVFMMSSVVLISSCTNDDERLTVNDTMAISEEAISEAYFEDADDMTSEVVFNGDYDELGGRKASTAAVSEDDRLVCATISFSPNSNEVSGQITIDFGAGCTFNGNIRQGKIILTYSDGPRGSIGFTVVTTFDGYKINGIQLKGTRTIERIEASAQANIKHAITLVNGEAIWPENGGKITRESDFTREWVRDVADERIELDGEASGTTRRGKSYNMNITETLVYRRACILEGIYMAAQGTKVFTTEQKEIIINYGDGDCDRTVTVTVSGITRNLSVGKN